MVFIDDIPPFAIAVDTPAKILKYRFTEEIIKKDEEMKRWDWPVSKILENNELFK